MTTSKCIKKYLLSLTMCTLGFSGFAQQVKYIGAEIVAASGNQTITESYYFTKSVTFTASGSNIITISPNGGTTFITPLAVNPPPSPEQNYVRVEVPKVPVTSGQDLTNFSADQKAVSYSYSDGLGRTTMSSAVEAGPLYEDLVQHVEHDPTGDQNESYLNYAIAYTKPGEFISDSKSATTGFYASPPPGVETDANPFGFAEYDERGRMASARPPGENWVSPDKETTYDYFVHKVGTNPDGNYKVAHWIIDNGEPVNDREYAANELSVVMSTDPQGQKTRTITDIRGLTITTQTYDPITSKWYGSYNVYDDFGRVRFIVPPILTTNLDTSFPNNFSTKQIDELMFQYQYDARGRVTVEKAPGTGWTYYVYDQWDRLVMTRYQGQIWEGDSSWTYYKYDALNRQVMSGQVKTEDSRSTIQNNKIDGKARYETLATNSGTYSNNSSFPRFPADYSNASYDLLTVNYYDNYHFLNDGTWGEDLAESKFNRVIPPGFSGIQLANALNLSTGSKVRILDATGGNQWLNTVVYYDDEGRVQQTVAENHLGDVDRLTNEFDWEGELQKMLLEHTSSSDAVDVLSEYEYAHNGQLEKSYQTINGGLRVLVGEYHYNALGQLIEKDLHSTNDGSSFLQAVNYQYNIQGALTNINDPTDLGSDLFGMKFHYETTSPVSGVNARHDGMLNTITWNAQVAAGQSGPDGNTQQGLGFVYDDRNRLKSTQTATAINNNTFDDDLDDFKMTAGYDDNGNIDDLTRKSDGSEIDDLDYIYQTNSNKLASVTDTAPNDGGLDDYYPGTDYAYNTQGNMISDMNKQIVEIGYNHFQYVDKIEFGDGTKLLYVYDAAGNRLSKEVKDGDNNTIALVDYIGSVEYLDGEINQLFTDEGRAYKQKNGYHYEYFLTDHQANNRVAFGNLPERNVYLATMEDDYSNYERSEFAFPANNNPTTGNNHTPLGEKSIALNGTNTNKQLGPMKVLEVQVNDIVEIEVYAKYNGSFTNGTGGGIGDFLSFFNDASAGTGAEGMGSTVQGMLGQSALFQSTDNNSTEPEAYLQYIFFDASYNFETQGSGFKPVTTSSDGKFFKLSSGELTFGKSGYLLVYVANESVNTNKDVWFDDLKITHSSSQTTFKVSQINDYYPFGLPTSNSWRAPGYVDPGLLYQSSYASYDSLTGYYDFLSRNYDPVLGRFPQVDPAGQFSSPYTGMGNVPHMGVDPNGETFLGFIAGALISTFGQAGVQSLNDGSNFWSSVTNNGFVIGGGYSQNQSYLSYGTGNLGTTSTYNFPNQGSAIFGGFERPDTPLDYSLPGPYQDGGLIAAYGFDRSSGSNYDFMAAMRWRNAFYPTIPLDGSGFGGSYAGGFGFNPCPTCDIQPGDWVNGPPPGYYDRRSGSQSNPAFVFSNSFERGVNLASTVVGGSFGAGTSQAARSGRYLAKAVRGARVGGNLLGGVGFGVTAYNVYSKNLNGLDNTADYVDLAASGVLLGAGFLVSNPIGWGFLIGAGVTYGVYRISYGDQADIRINQHFGFR